MKTLRVENLVKYYGDRKVLSGSFFEIQRGQINSIVGRNGCGKTTFLNALTGRLSGTKEVLFLDGQIIPRKKRIFNTAFLSQQSFLPKNVKVRQIISAFLPPQKGRSLLADERIQPLLNLKAGKISGGEKRYLEFFLVSSLDREVYIFDEPFIGIEPLYINRVYSRLEELKSEGKYIILTDHDFHSVQSISDRIWLSRGGELKPADNEKAGILQNHYLPVKD